MRGAEASWIPDLRQAVLDNLRNLGVDVLDAVNLRVMSDVHEPSERSIAWLLTALAQLQPQGLIWHLGLGNGRGVADRRSARDRARVCVREGRLQFRAPRRRRVGRRPGSEGDRLCASPPPRAGEDRVRVHA